MKRATTLLLSALVVACQPDEPRGATPDAATPLLQQVSATANEPDEATEALSPIPQPAELVTEPDEATEALSPIPQPAELVTEPADTAAPLPRESPPQRRRILFKEFEPGFEAFEGTGDVSNRRVQLKMIRVVPRQHQLEVVAESSLKGEGRYLPEFAKMHNAKAAISGGFLKSFYPSLPLGYVQVDGSPLNRGETDDLLNGLLVTRNGVPEIFPWDGGEAARDWEDALQSGPLLLLAGESALPRDSASLTPSTRELIQGRFRRAFVALDNEGRAILGVTGLLTLGELVAFLSTPQDLGGLGARDAINLGGAESAGLISPRALEFDEGNFLPLPNAIIVH